MYFSCLIYTKMIGHIRTANMIMSFAWIMYIMLILISYGNFFFLAFYTCDAMLVWIITMCLCLSFTSRCSVKRDERINLVFGMEVCPTLCFKEIEVSTKIRLLPSGTLRKILPWHINRRMCYQLSSRKMNAQSMINWTIVSQLS